jgi:hypothetical protein
LTFNGSRYDLDLCERHSEELSVAITAWADLGTKTGETGIFDRQKTAADVTVKLSPPVPTVKCEPKPVATPIHTALAQDPDLPLTASRWQLSAHANQQMKERGFSLADVLWAAERPDWTTSCKRLEERRIGLFEHTKGGCTAVVDPHDQVVITVLYAEGEPALAGNRDG